MELRIIIFTLSNPRATMSFSHHQKLLCRTKTFNCFVVLLCILFFFSAYGLCSTNVRQNSPEYYAYESSGKHCNCKLVILTNDTTSPQVEIPCEEALHICFEHQRLSSVGIKDKTKLVDFGGMRAEYVVRKLRLPPNVKPLVKEIYAKNTGDLPLEVKTMKVSGRECGLDGFKIHDCKGFALDFGESKKLLISYQIDFSAGRIHRDLELALASGIFLIPMKGCVPYDKLCNCKNFVFWARVKKWLLRFIFVASLLLMVSLDNQRKDKSSISGKMTNMFCSDGKSTISTMQATCVRYLYDQSETSDQEVSQHLTQDLENNKQISLSLDSQKEGKSLTASVQSSDVVKPSQQSELNIKDQKEKGRRRKKKKTKKESVGATLTASSEVSSSQSGNSTPSSPSSPVAPASTKYSQPLSLNVKQPPIHAHSLQTPDTAQHPKKPQASSSAAKANTLKHMVPVKFCSNQISSPKVSHSPSTNDASIPPFKMFCAASPMPPSSSVSTSSVSLSCRAPGSKLDKQKTVLSPKKEELAEEYTYDIWGGHLSGLHLLVPKDVTCMKSSPAEKNFNSFFLGDPNAIK